MKILISLLFYIFGGIGVSLTIKSGIGVSPFDSLCLSISQATSIKVGTINFLGNILFLTIFILLSKGKHPKKYILMILSILSFGWVINLFTYTVFGALNIDTYYIKVLVFIIGILISSFSVSVVLYLDVIPFSIENMCIEMSKLSKKSFSLFRYGFDIISISISLLLSLGYKLPINVREGTIIALFIFPGVISLSYNYFNKHFPQIKKQEV